MVIKNHNTCRSSSGSHRHDNITAGTGSPFADSQIFQKLTSGNFLLLTKEKIRTDRTRGH